MTCQKYHKIVPTSHHTNLWCNFAETSPRRHIGTCRCDKDSNSSTSCRMCIILFTSSILHSLGHTKQYCQQTDVSNQKYGAKSKATIRLHSDQAKRKSQILRIWYDSKHPFGRIIFVRNKGPKQSCWTLFYGIGPKTK